MIFLCVATGIIAILFILFPFFNGEGGQLAPSAQENSFDRLVKIKLAILKRYIADEDAMNNSEIGKKTWELRKKFLVNRYVDAARRLDYLQSLSQEENSSLDGNG